MPPLRYLRHAACRRLKRPAAEKLWLDEIRRALDQLDWVVPFAEEGHSRFSPLHQLQLVTEHIVVRCSIVAEPSPPRAVTLPVAVQYPNGEFFGNVHLILLNAETLDAERIAVYECRQE